MNAKFIGKLDAVAEDRSDETAKAIAADYVAVDGARRSEARPNLRRAGLAGEATSIRRTPPTQFAFDGAEDACFLPEMKTRCSLGASWPRYPLSTYTRDLAVAGRASHPDRFLRSV
jgi:hypothetical protein